jgi:GT2 family glycosyltransferase
MFNCSIVTYKHKGEEIKSLVSTILRSSNLSTLFIVDNSPTDELKYELTNYSLSYIFNNGNIGFGAAHNIALTKSIEAGVEYHLVVNPDIILDAEVIDNMTQRMDEDTDIGLLMPKILYPDGSVQYLPKLLPKPSDLVIRRISILRKAFPNLLDQYEMKQYSGDQTFISPIISGCFSLFRVKVLQQVGLYDKRFFMYFEDFDLSRRINLHYKTVYYNDVHVYHAYERGAQKSLKLFKFYIKSAVKYFNKWGWLFDKKRSTINHSTLNQFKIK